MRYPEIKPVDNVVPLHGSDASTTISDEELKKQSKQHKPRGLSRAQAKVWDRVMPEFIRAQRFKPLFLDFYRQYCVVVARMEETLDLLEDIGWSYTTEGRNGVQHKPRPQAAQYNDDWRKWNSLVNQIGMSPATDQRFHNHQPDLFEDDIYK